MTKQELKRLYRNWRIACWLDEPLDLDYRLIDPLSDDDPFVHRFWTLLDDDIYNKPRRKAIQRLFKAHTDLRFYSVRLACNQSPYRRADVPLVKALQTLSRIYRS